MSDQPLYRFQEVVGEYFSEPLNLLHKMQHQKIDAKIMWEKAVRKYFKVRSKEKEIQFGVRSFAMHEAVKEVQEKELIMAELADQILNYKPGN